MRALLDYLGAHPWQRRALTALVAVILGAAAGMAVYVGREQRQIIRDLGSPDPVVRVRAMARAADEARQSPRMLRRLRRALRDPSDVRFMSAASVLKRLDAFMLPEVQPEAVDRLRSVELQAAEDERVRCLTVVELLRDGRDNRFVRQALATAAEDETASVRELACMLAARLWDVQRLQRLAEDADVRVASGAWLSAAAAKRLDGLSPPKSPQSLPPEVVVALAHALAQSRPAQAAVFIGEALEDPRLGGLREGLIEAVAEAGNDEARSLVAGHLEQARRHGRYPLPLALESAASLGLPIEADVRQTLRGSRSEGQLLEAHLLAGLAAARVLDMRVDAEALAICRQLWGADVTLTLNAAIEAMSAGQSTAEVEAESDDEVMEFLRQAASLPPPATASSENAALAMPAAAAAVTLWELRQDGAEELLRTWAQCGVPGTRDYIAWRLARGPAGRRALDLGRSFLPPPGEAHVYSDPLRATGALLLALVARDVEQRLIARGRIRSRLEGGAAGGEDDPVTAGTFRCALLMLDVPSQLARVRALLTDPRAFPRRRAWTALLATGDAESLDGLLLLPDASDDAVADLLVAEGLGEVLTACAAQLPRVDAAAGAKLRRLQVRRLRHAWGVSRPPLELEDSP